MLKTDSPPSVREVNENDYENIVDYFLKADKDFLHRMGVDINLLPKRDDWLNLLLYNHNKIIENKTIFYVIWLLGKTAVGHSNINKIIFGKEAYMHLHLWQSDKRQKGIGSEFMKMSIPYYFNNFKLKKLFCEPYALNPAPNKILEKLGFEFIKQHETIPGWINFHQPVNRWCMDADKFKSLYT